MEDRDIAELKPIGIWETYDGQIMAERQKGKPLEQVGSELGVSRERVRQVLMEHYGTTQIALPTEKEVAGQLGVDRFFVAGIRKKGIVKPQRYGNRWRYSLQVVEKVKRCIDCVCPICGGPKKTVSRACYSCWRRHRRLLEQKEGGDALGEHDLRAINSPTY